MRVRPRTHPPGTSLTKYSPFGADLMRAYRKKRKAKNKARYKKRFYNRKHGRFGGRQ